MVYRLFSEIDSIFAIKSSHRTRESVGIKFILFVTFNTTPSVAATMSDELAEIDGIKPKVLLREGDQKELGSKSRWVLLQAWKEFSTEQ